MMVTTDCTLTRTALAALAAACRKRKKPHNKGSESEPAAVLRTTPPGAGNKPLPSLFPTTLASGDDSISSSSSSISSSSDSDSSSPSGPPRPATKPSGRGKGAVLAGGAFVLALALVGLVVGVGLGATDAFRPKRVVRCVIGSRGEETSAPSALLHD